jgi:chromosome segregation ATPase
MSQNNSQSEKPSWIRNTLRFLVRFLLVVVLGLVAGVGIYLGVTYLANRYFQSVQVNTQQIQALQENQTQAEELAKQRLDAVIGRLQSLETSGDTLKVFEADIQSRLAALETARPAQNALLETLTSQQEQLDTIQKEQLGTLQANLSLMQSTQQALASGLSRLASSNADQNTAIQTLTAEWPGAQATIAASLLDVQRLKAMELLSRARFNLYQNNLGLARQDIQSASRIILAVQSQEPADQAGMIDTILARLDGALEKLPDFPVAASDELEDAWSLLVTGISTMPTDVTAASSTPTPNRTPGPSPSPTASPTPKP